MNVDLKEEKNRSTFCKQLEELTGETNTDFLIKAYHECRGDLAKAIEYLNSYNSEYFSNSMPDFTGRTLSHHKRSRTASAMRQTPDEFQISFADINVPLEELTPTEDVYTNGSLDGGNPVIDLTGGLCDSDLEQAIKLSMELNNTLPTTTPDPSNIPSTSSSKQTNTNINAITKKDAKLVSNPNARKRKSLDWPAGLKNVGNTCWFSAVIQSLFSLPVFRSLILHHRIPRELPQPQTARYKNVLFLKELRNLFALLINSHQSYIDPSRCVDKLHARFVSNDKCQQQDVSEFTHKLLDWLEDALAYTSNDSGQCSIENNIGSPMEVDLPENSPVSDKEKQNPMVDLFYGKYKAHGINNGSSFTKPQNFGLFPLYVNGVGDLHDSLEFTTRDRMHHDSTAGQEHWFTKLPPVLIFELSRFHFNQNSGATEKIHSKFGFPETLFMDRYMESNAERTRQCREDCSNLISQLNALKEELKKKRKMNLDGKCYLVQDMLKCCTQFAACKRKRYISSKIKHSSKKARRISNEEMSSIESEGGVADESGMGDGIENDDDEEVKNTLVVEQCLKNWLEELEQEKEALRDDINDIQKRLDTMYDDPALKQHPYVLHSVLVHQGFAVAGHYWAFVRDHQNSRWLKFNDIDVKESNWDELRNDSVGGGCNAITSAYCLMYIDKNREELLMDVPNSDKILSSDNELQSLVDKHNMEFAKELDDWQLEQAKLLSLMSTQNESEQSAESADMKEVSEAVETSEEVPAAAPARERKESSSLSQSWNENDCKDAIEKCSNLYETLGSEETLDQLVKEEWDRLRQLERNFIPDVDVRLKHIAVYMFRNKAPRKVIERTLLEQFANDGMRYDDRATEIMKCAKAKLQSLSPEDKKDDEHLRWNRDYRAFCKATCYLVEGLELLRAEKYAEALPYLASVKTENQKILAPVLDPTLDDRIADWDLAVRAITRCIRLLHNEAFEKVQSRDDDTANEGVNILSDSIVPWIHVLQDNNFDSKQLERMQTDWCCFDIYSDNIREKLECARHALMEPPTQKETLDAFHAPMLIRPQNSHELYERYQKALLNYNKRPSTSAARSQTES